MTRRRQLGAAFLAVGVCALALVFGASPVHAEAPSQTAWWFELQTSSLPTPLPSVPVVPDGGLYVQQGPDGPTAYGALHYAAADATSATLTLTTAPGSTASLGAPVQACVTSSKWTAPKSEPGPWSDAPKYGTPCTPGKIAADGSAVAFFFNTAFFTKDAVDVAIVPIDGAAPFSLVFNKPADDSLSLASKPTPFSSSGGSKPAGGAGAAAAGSAATQSPSRVASVTPAAKPATPAAPSTPAAPASNSSRPSVANSVLNVAGLGDPDRGERAVALAGASAIVIGWWLLSTRALPMPRLLGALAGGGDAAASEPKAHVGGVGRFAKGRTNPARRIR